MPSTERSTAEPMDSTRKRLFQLNSLKEVQKLLTLLHENSATRNPSADPPPVVLE